MSMKEKQGQVKSPSSHSRMKKMGQKNKQPQPKDDPAADHRKRRFLQEAASEAGDGDNDVYVSDEDLDEPGEKKKKRKIRDDDVKLPDVSSVICMNAITLAALSIPEKCDWIAALSEAVLENPKTAFKATSRPLDVLQGAGSSKNISSTSSSSERIKNPLSPMSQLLLLADERKNRSGPYVAQLAIMSLLAIFQDLLPGYRIRLPTTKEMAVKVSRDVKDLWDYEKALLQTYQEYLKVLEHAWESGKQAENNNNNGSASPKALAIAAILSMAELLKKAFHFNFRSNLITAVVKQMNHSLPTVSQACCGAVEFVFEHDKQGDVALEAVRQVAKMIQNRHFEVHARVLQTFVVLPLRVHDDEAIAAKLASQANAKKRKRDKQTAAIEAELKEGSAMVDKLTLARCQSDMLQAVIMTYFRILKAENLKTKHMEALLPPALEGLAKFAHLINMETVVDLLAVLKELLKKVDSLPVDAALNCVLTAFQTLHGPGKEFKIDVKEYIMPVYTQLPRLVTQRLENRKSTDVMLSCLDAAFLRRREFSTVRTAAFFKQILSTALHCPAEAAVPLLAFARLLTSRYCSAVPQLLENESDVITSGVYNPDVEDPEHSNPYATAAWELALHKFHINPIIQQHAEGASTMKMLQLPAESPERLRKELVCNADEMYIPYKRLSKKHPLASKEKVGQDEAKKKQQSSRFVKPRVSESFLLSPKEVEQICGTRFDTLV